jgi:hypothetical protein
MGDRAANPTSNKVVLMKLRLKPTSERVGQGGSTIQDQAKSVSSAVEDLSMLTIPELLRDHVSLDLECVDRVYLNGYVPTLQSSGA